MPGDEPFNREIVPEGFTVVTVNGWFTPSSFAYLLASDLHTPYQEARRSGVQEKSQSPPSPTPIRMFFRLTM